jgi:hypothetical protein
VGLVSALAVLLGAQAFAQDSAPIAAPSSTPEAEAAQGVDEVVVRGRRMSEVEFDLRAYVRSFVDQVAALPPGQGYARWYRRVCIGVHNLETRAAQYIADRVSELAAEVGLEAGEPGCRPDVMIIFTVDGKQTASFIAEERPRLLRPGGGLGAMNLTLEDLQEFAESDRAVRWWHVSMPVGAHNGDRATTMARDDSAPAVRVQGASRIHSGIRDDMSYVIIVVDAAKLLGTTWQQLGDYLAMVSLAQIDPRADLSAFDSILNVFSNPLAYSGLTDWDRSYIRALYSFNQEQQPHLQANELVSLMTRDEQEIEDSE